MQHSAVSCRPTWAFPRAATAHGLCSHRDIENSDPQAHPNRSVCCSSPCPEPPAYPLIVKVTRSFGDCRNGEGSMGKGHTKKEVPSQDPQRGQVRSKAWVLIGCCLPGTRRSCSLPVQPAGMQQPGGWGWALQAALRPADVGRALSGLRAAIPPNILQTKVAHWRQSTCCWRLVTAAQGRTGGRAST